MTSQAENTRDRIRELVRQVLDSVPADESTATPDVAPEHFVVNSMKTAVEREFDRDESSKSLITEDDLRGLDSGARVRVSESARVTPLASDIVNDKHIRLIRKQAR